jgi:large subunit ribosomal protein L29
MKASELKSLTVDEVKSRLEDLLDELSNLRIQKATRHLVNASRVKVVKKEIARHKTVLREFELGISKPKLES